MKGYRARRVIAIAALLVVALVAVWRAPDAWQPLWRTEPPVRPSTAAPDESPLARTVLDGLAVKGRAPKTGYSRTQFGNGWRRVGLCDMRNIILHRDLEGVVVNDECKVTSGTLRDPYTDAVISFVRGATTSDDVQIDHVVALSDAWQKGAQALTAAEREAMANDPLELIAVDGAANQAKADSDAATWLPPAGGYRCQYVARQIAVKQKYRLWVTSAEREAMVRVLDRCPVQRLPVAEPLASGSLTML